MESSRLLQTSVFPGEMFMGIHQEQPTPKRSRLRPWGLSFTVALGLSLGATPSVAQSTFSPSVTTGTATMTLAAQSSTVAQMEAQVWQQINQRRQRHGLPPLKLNPQLSLVARSHSQQMAHHNFYSHIDPQGRNHRRRVEASGLRAYVIGENLMKCIQSHDPVGLSVQSWMDSPAHRKNILLSEMRETGVGIWRKGQTYYVTQIYMEPK